MNGEVWNGQRAPNVRAGLSVSRCAPRRAGAAHTPGPARRAHTGADGGRMAGAGGSRLTDGVGRGAVEGVRPLSVCLSRCCARCAVGLEGFRRSVLRLSFGAFEGLGARVFQKASEFGGFGRIRQEMGRLRRILEHSPVGPRFPAGTQTHFGTVVGPWNPQRPRVPRPWAWRRAHTGADEGIAARNHQERGCRSRGWALRREEAVSWRLPTRRGPGPLSGPPPPRRRPTPRAPRTAT